MIELTGAVAGYGRAQVLREISLTLDEGEVLAVVGANGAGKTTLVSTIAGSVPLWGGTLRFEDRDVTRLGPEDRLELGIALCPEGRRIFASLSVEENLRVGATVASAPSGLSRRAEIARRVETAYELFPILGERRNLKGGQLSGGQQQMLAIARALMARPKVMLLDEPSLGLAPVIVRELYALIGRLRDEGLGIILVEESTQRALAFADRAMVIKNGSLALEGPVDVVAASPLLASVYVGGIVEEA